MRKTIKDRGLAVRESNGFTLIELLVVIAIIGILSSVVLASLTSARKKGRVAAAQSTMKGIQTGGAMCTNELPVQAIAAPTMTRNGGLGALCAGNPTAYSQLPVGWIYCDATSVAGAGTATACNNSALNAPFIQTSGVSFRVSAYSSVDLITLITCTEMGCTTQTAL